MYTIALRPQWLYTLTKYSAASLFGLVLASGVPLRSALATTNPLLSPIQDSSQSEITTLQTTSRTEKSALIPQVSGPAQPSFTLVQAVTAADDGTGTVVTQTDNTFDVTGGTESGRNLFHSFEQLGLEADQIANILSNPAIDNILGRVVGGDPSLLNGLLQVTGGESNLFLVNPAGVVFGNDFQLSVPGSFSATTADAIEIDDFWFNAAGANDYENLAGMPSGFAFINRNPSAVMNAGALTVPNGEQVTLIGGAVVNTGTITAPGGTIHISSVPGDAMVEISQEGNLLSLGLPAATPRLNTDLNTPVEGLDISDIPELLAMGAVAGELGLVVEGGVTKLVSTGAAIATEVGTTMISGELTVASAVEGSGGSIDVLGERVDVLDAALDASGPYGGGSIRVGGDYRGEGPVANAAHTSVDADSTIVADARLAGDGGRVIIWADDGTRFYGDVSAQGGLTQGGGGFVEVSGQQNLAFDGVVNVNATNGALGTLLLDPANVLISSTAGSDRFDSVVSPTALTTQTTGNVVLEATNDIVMTDGLSLTFGEGGSITFTADSDGDGAGSFLVGDSTTPETLTAPDSSNSVNAPNDPLIQTSGRDLIISGASIVAGNIDTSGSQNGGDVNLTSTTGNVIVGYINTSGRAGGNVNIDANKLFRSTRFTPTSSINANGGLGIFSAGIFDDSNDEIPNLGGLNGGRFTIIHGGDDFIVSAERLSSEESSIAINFTENPVPMFGENDSGSVGAIVTKNTNGTNNAIYEDASIGSAGDLARAISILSRDEASNIVLPERPSIDSSESEASDTKGAEEAAEENETEEGDEENDTLCETFVSSEVLDVIGLAPAECQEGSVEDIPTDEVKDTLLLTE